MAQRYIQAQGFVNNHEIWVKCGGNPSYRPVPLMYCRTNFDAK